MVQDAPALKQHLTMSGLCEQFVFDVVSWRRNGNALAAEIAVPFAGQYLTARSSAR